jgi:hypothetical protein
VPLCPDISSQAALFFFFFYSLEKVDESAGERKKKNM